MDKKPAIACDMDGTLSSCEWRRHYVTPKSCEICGGTGKMIRRVTHEKYLCGYCKNGFLDTNWVSFFENMNADAPNPLVKEILNMIKPHVEVIILSARPDSYRYQTEWWLEEHQVWYDHLMMRYAGDSRKDEIVKEEILINQILPFYDLRFVIDDRPQVIEMWKRNGIPVIEIVDPNLPPIFLDSDFDPNSYPNS
jgi:hypothetical protein